MDGDDFLPNSPGDPLGALARQDLDPLSLDELDARVVALEAEITRCRARRALAVNDRASAESLFRR